VKSEIVLIGGGGHCKSCIDVIEQTGKFTIAGIVDAAEKIHQKICGYEIIATDEDLHDLVKEYQCFHISLGQIKSPQTRITLFQRLQGLGGNLPVIVSPYAYLSNHAQVGDGTIVMHHALINAQSKVGCNCIINTKALIEHDAVVEDHCHISTCAVVNGGATVGSGSFMGSNATCRENVSIGNNCVVGANVFVDKNLTANSIVKKNYRGEQSTE